MYLNDINKYMREKMVFCRNVVVLQPEAQV